MKRIKKVALVGLALLAMVFVCLIGIALIAPDPDVTEPAVVVEVAEEEIQPTKIPTKAPVKPPPTAMPVVDCKELFTFEFVIKGVSEMTPNFQPTNVGVWDLVWEIERPGGVYSIMLTEKNGCLDMAGSISVFYLDSGDFSLAGEMQGMVAGFFSDSNDGISWLQAEITNECPYALTQYSASKMMSDGTLWEVLCKADYTEEMMSVGMTIYPK